MGLRLLAKLQRIWASWDVRCFVLLSLFLQSFLLLIAPFRKRSGSMMVHGMVWLTYQVADLTALFANGLISDTQSARATGASSHNNINDVMVFWSPFLLVHLGGPDTITAFSLEDNELWTRHLLKLVGQLVSTGLVFYRSFPTNELLLATIVMSIAGIIKYSERIRSLHRASVKKIRKILLEDPDPGPNYAKLMEEYATRSEERITVGTEVVREPHRPFKYTKPNTYDHGSSESRSHGDMVRAAFHYYRKFRGLVVDLIFSHHESQESRIYLQNQGVDNAFKIVEIELNFVYDVLYTKAIIIHDRAHLGYLLRLVYSTLLGVSFGIWYFKDKRSQHFSPYDVKITYALLFGAIALDLVSYCMLISSDWMTALAQTKGEKENRTILEKCVVMIGRTMDKPRFLAHRYPKFLSKRWSEFIQQHNLIDCCLRGSSLCDKLYDRLGIQDVKEDFQHVTKSEQFCSPLKGLIFDELKRKSEFARSLEDAEKIYTARGEWVLEHFSKDWSVALRNWVREVEFDESLILWHIATELIYNYDEINPQSKEDRTNKSPRGDSYQEAPGQDEESTNGLNPGEDSYREMSKVLSNYMFYLLIREPKMMAEVSSIAYIRFRDTVEEATVFIRNLGLDPNDNGKRRPLLKSLGLDPNDKGGSLLKRLVVDPKEKSKRRHFIIKNLWGVKTTLPPKEAKGDRSKSVLFNGCQLAKEIERQIPRDKKWELICKVWVEMLSYAAVNCRGNEHAANLGRGGHLVTLVWLLMVHLGLGKQFRIKKGNTRIKLVEAET